MGTYYTKSNDSALTRGTEQNPEELTNIKATADLNTIEVDGFLINNVSNSSSHPDFRRKVLYTNHVDNAIGNNTITDYGVLTNNGDKQSMQYSRFGSLLRGQSNRNNGDYVNSYYYFSIGEVTPASSMPTSGTAHYSGFATDSTEVERRAYFNVDFGAKTVDGTMSSVLDAQGNDLGAVAFRLHGNINGSSFEGSRVQTEINNSTDIMHMKGRFYGPEAKEMGGVYYGQNGAYSPNVTGSFGAKKD